MSGEIKVIKPGLFTTIQDLGRYHFAHLGISPAGAADSISFRLANLLLGNPEKAPALEMTLIGPTLEFHSDAVIAIAGASTSSGLPMLQKIDVAAGTQLDFGPLTNGARTYMALQGTLELPEVLHSFSTLAAAHLGGLEGRALKAGDSLSFQPFQTQTARILRPSVLEKFQQAKTIRVTKSLQSDWFNDPLSSGTSVDFLNATFTVTEQSNRAGLRLSGPPVTAHRRHELLTEGISLGAIQIPPDGQPIILFVDQQTTGGYPKIANVIAADLPRIGQLRPRDEIKFRLVEIDEAVEILRQQEAALQDAFE